VIEVECEVPRLELAETLRLSLHSRALHRFAFDEGALISANSRTVTDIEADGTLARTDLQLSNQLARAHL
jgi:hypothetical protein